MSYASAKGRAPVVPKPDSRKPPPELSDAEKVVIAGRVRVVKEYIPEALDFVKSLHELGMVDGLRCIVAVRVFEGDEHGVDG